MSPERSAGIELLRLRQEVHAELVALDQIRSRLERVARVGLPGSAEEAVSALLAVDLHGYYGAVEAMFTRISRVVEGSLPKGADWHRDLLRSMSLQLPEVRPAVISQESEQQLLPLLSFRHFFRHAYSVTLDRARLLGHAERVLGVHARLREELAHFVDQATGSLEP